MSNDIQSIVARLKERGEHDDAQKVQDLFMAFIEVTATHMHAQELLLEQNPQCGMLN
jgi:hypothetical protein